jgi:AraC-like DNA-binding protein
LLTTDLVTVKDVQCRGSHSSRSTEEYSSRTHLVFPYRGIYVRHVGSEQAVADANHVLFFNASEGYRVSHPIAGGDASLVLLPGESILQEIVPASIVEAKGTVLFRKLQQPIDPRAHALVAILRRGLQDQTIEPLEAETLLLALVRRSLAPGASHQAAATYGRRRLVDRVKVALASDLARRWTLADIAEQIGASPVYLTQVFKQTEGIPLYRYQLRLRLARALELLPDVEDLTTLALDLGFSSHSHFSAAFRQAYGRSPSGFKRAVSSKAALSHA